MRLTDLNGYADYLDLIFAGAQGVFPLPVLEALIARMEVGK